MGGGLMQLVAYGAQDIYLTGNPQITFFKVVYRRYTNFSMEAIQQTWNGNSTGSTGSRCTATIARNGDLVYKLYIQINATNTDSTYPDIAPNVIQFNGSNPGCSWIDDVAVSIGGQIIDKQYGSWLETWAELTQPNPSGVVAGNSNASSALSASCITSSNTLFQRTTGMGGVSSILAQAPNNNIASYLPQLNSGPTLYIPLQFWFNRNPGLALPLIALQYHEVTITLNHRLEEVFGGTELPNQKVTQQLWADYIYLDTDERRRFAQVSHEYLIEQVQQQVSTGAVIELIFNHPVKELIWTGKWQRKVGGNTVTAIENQGYNHPLIKYNDLPASDTYIIKLNGQDRFSARPVTYFTQQQVYEYHSGPGGLLTNKEGVQISGSGIWEGFDLQFIGNSFNDSIAVYSFALEPEEHQPSGTCNFSRIDTAQLIRNTNKEMSSITTVIYAINYNVLRIMSGMGGLAYSN